MVREYQMGPQVGKNIFSYACIDKYIKRPSPKPAGQFDSNLILIILAWIEFKFVQKGSNLHQRGDNDKNTNIRWGSLKYFLKNHCSRKTQIYMKTS
jgi:hypothetical protein